MRILIIEDELPAANRLVDLIHMYDKSIQVVGLVDSNKALVSWVKSNNLPDLIFSDIELLDGQVFQALDNLELSVPIVFTTAYEQYALEAFETNGISYLLKPFEYDGIKKAIEKFKMLKNPYVPSKEIIHEVRSLLNARSNKYKTKLLVKVGNGVYLLDINDITCVATQNGIPYAYKSNGKKLPLSELISELEETLNPHTFYRINRGEIINVNYIDKIEPYFNDRLAVQVKGYSEKLIISTSRTPEFRKWLNGI